LPSTSKHGTMKASIARIDNRHAALLRHFDELMTREHDRHQGHNNNNNNYDEQVDDNWDEYSTDSELDDHDARRPVQHNRHGRGGHQRREVRNNGDVFHKLKFKIQHFDGKYNLDAYISWELAVEQQITSFEFPENARVRAASSEFSDFAYVWWVEYGKKHPNDIPQIWICSFILCT
jgi:stalled ribosome alternative rescue factor ArfA